MTETGRPILTAAQESFCLFLATPDEDGRCPQAREAYLRAYPACKVPMQASKRASLLLAKPEIQERIKEHRERLRIEYLESKLPYRNLIDKLAEGLEAMVVKTASHNGKIGDAKAFIDYPTRRGYLELALKLKGEMPAEKQEISGPDGGPIPLPGPDLSNIPTDNLRQIVALMTNHESSSTTDPEPAAD